MEPFLDWMERKRSNKNISDGLHSRDFQLWLYIGKGHSHLPCSRYRFHHIALSFDGGILQGKNFKHTTYKFFFSLSLSQRVGFIERFMAWPSITILLTKLLILKLNIYNRIDCARHRLHIWSQVLAT